MWTSNVPKVPSERKVPSRQRVVKLANQRPNTKQTFQSQINNNEDFKKFEKDTPEYLQKLIKKILYPNSPVSDIKDALPALTSSTNVDLQLYSLVGLLFKSFIHRWYCKLTDDQEFIDEIIQIISHLTRSLETRIRSVDLTLLLLDDLPLVLDDHLKAYRKIHSELGSTFLPNDTMDKAIDHISQHFALGKEKSSEGDYLKILSKNAMKYLLPGEDLNSTLVHEFVKSLLSDLLLRNIIEKLTQPYQIFEIISIMCEMLLSEKDEEQVSQTKDSEVNGLEKIQSFFTHFMKLISNSTSSDTSSKESNTLVYSLSCFQFLNNLFQISNSRPVLYAFIKSTTPVASKLSVNHLLNNLIHNVLIKPFQNESLVAMVIQKLRNNLFPQDDEMGPSRIEPDLEEFENIRKTTKNNLKAVCEKFKLLTTLIIATDAELDDVLDDFLTTFENKRINKHLIYRLLDLIILRLIPELSNGMQ